MRKKIETKFVVKKYVLVEKNSEIVKKNENKIVLEKNTLTKFSELPQENSPPPHGKCPPRNLKFSDPGKIVNFRK